MLRVSVLLLSMVWIAGSVHAQFAVNWNENRLSKIESFSSRDRIAGTYYFYWYDYPDEHFYDDAAREDDALQDHFPEPEMVSYNSVAWHERELADIAAAGIDFILPVYWGTLDNYFSVGTWFSVRGLGPLQRAIEERQRRGEPVPKIGLFYDTSTLLAGVRRKSGEPAKPDLTAPEGKDLFYRTIRDFFQQIKPEHWAAIDGKPIVVLYGSGFASGHDQSTAEYVYEQFASEFHGVRPYIIREVSWNMKTENVYAWGAALAGPSFHGVACVGPGYNDSAVPGRSTPIRDREEGNFYKWGWLQVLRSDARIALIETWNEMHEGTDVCRSKEYGDQYIRLTAEFVNKFKNNERVADEIVLKYPDPLPRPGSKIGKEYANAESVQIRLEDGLKEQGLYLVRGQPDGPVSIGERAGRSCLFSPETKNTTYLYFSIADPFTFEEKHPMEIRVTYLDTGFSQFLLQYDSHDRKATLNGVYKDSTVVRCENSGQWKTAIFPLTDARFVNRQNGASDFRLAIFAGSLAVSEISVRKRN